MRRPQVQILIGCAEESDSRKRSMSSTNRSSWASADRSRCCRFLPRPGIAIDTRAPSLLTQFIIVRFRSPSYHGACGAVLHAHIALKDLAPEEIRRHPKIFAKPNDLICLALPHCRYDPPLYLYVGKSLRRAFLPRDKVAEHLHKHTECVASITSTHFLLYTLLDDQLAWSVALQPN
jgi:hypothetical protein